MILEDATFEAFGYLPSGLLRKSNKPLIAACECCGKIRILRRADYITFCISCSMILGGKQKGKNNPMFDKCREEASNWRGGLIDRVCIQCGKEFPVRQDEIKKGYGKYCCKLCWSKAQRHSARPRMTASEKVFQQICVDNRLPFKFVGDGSLWLGNANPDFIHTGKRKRVIEVFGDYWHSPLLNKFCNLKRTLEYRKKQLKAEGYKCIIIWESDLKRKDAEEFVRHLIQKEKIVEK